MNIIIKVIAGLILRVTVIQAAMVVGGVAVVIVVKWNIMVTTYTPTELKSLQLLGPV
jgi:hypothetical protein